MIVESQYCKLDLPDSGLLLEKGDKIKDVVVCYEQYGEMNSTCNNIILVCTPLTMDAHAAGFHLNDLKSVGWWDSLIGSKKSLDTDQYCVIVTNVFGGCQGTTGPSSINPETKKPYGNSFPKITMKDIVLVQYLLIKQLGVSKLEAVIGGSMGGMQALEWSAQYSEMVKKCICIAAGTSLSPQGLGFKVVSRQILENDPQYFEGNYYQHKTKPKKGLALARMIGIITYLSSSLMQTKFGRSTHSDKPLNEKDFSTNFEVERYLNYNADKFTERFDANSYLYLTYAVDTFDLIQSHGSLEKAFGESETKFLFITLSSDWLFPPQQSKILCKDLLKLKRHVSLVNLQSNYGHDGFLLETKNIAPLLNGFVMGESHKGKERESDTVVHTSDLLKFIKPKSHILDVGCGDNSLIEKLYQKQKNTGFGIDIDFQNVGQSLSKGLPIIHSDVDKGLKMFKNGSFDYAILSYTMEALKKPREVLQEILRVAERGIVVFPNFGYIQYRLYLFLLGRMPKTTSLPHEWWETPNIHLFTYQDFEKLCRVENLKIEKKKFITKSVFSKILVWIGFPNLGAESVMVQVKKD